MRRKGEKPVPRQLIIPSSSSPVVRAISQGDPWFQAWSFQQCTPGPRLARMTRISPERLRAIELGDRIMRCELEALAMAWSVSPDNLISTMVDPPEITD